MKPYFIKTSVESVSYQGKTFNVPVNLNLCISIEKIDIMFHKNWPTIRFCFAERNIDWMFNNEEERDWQYDLIFNKLEE